MDRELSLSANLRGQGNIFYKQALHGGFGSIAIRVKLSRALQLYNQALMASSTPDDTASCFKNLGMLHWLWCKIELQQVLTSPSSNKTAVSASLLSPCKFYLFKSVRFLLLAKKHGTLVDKGQPWIDHIDSVLVSMADWGACMSRTLNITHAPLLHYLCDAFEDAVKEEASFISTCGTCILKAYLAYGTSLLEQGSQKIAEDAPAKDYTGCLGLLRQCNTSLQRAEGFVPSDADLQKLQESVCLQQAICEAMQAVELGDRLLPTAAEREINMDAVQDSLDHYRQALQKARSLHVDSEGIALSRIGKVYSDVLKLPEKGHKYHLQVLELARSSESPNITQSSWYIYSLEKVRMHEEHTAAQERRRREEHLASQQREYHVKRRTPILEKLLPSLTKLTKEAERGAESFLRYLYSAHPHPDLKRKLDLSSDKLVKDKASLKKAICHYHPDANIRYGDEWKVFCEEICKLLNLKYRAWK